MRKYLVGLLFAALTASAAAQYTVEQLHVEQLPNFHIARTNHRTLCIDGVPTVLGGHTDGFKPTATAEYFSNGKWHLMEMVYAHDDGLVLPLKDGRVLLAGGHEKDLGIGLIHSAEMYDPVTHTFEGFGCLDTKRAIFGGTEIDSGRVVISGGWYHDDSMEMFDGRQSFTFIKDVAQPRSRPYIFRTAPDNAVVFSVCGPTVDEIHDTIIVDQLHGEPFSPTIFQQWKPLRLHFSFNGEQSRIDDYTYLFPVTDSTGQVAIAQLQGFDGQSTMVNGPLDSAAWPVQEWSTVNGKWSILPTDYPVPMYDEHWQEHLSHAPDGMLTGGIQWLTPVIADRQRGRAYMVGAASVVADSIGSHPQQKSQLLYVLAIDSLTSPTLHLSLYYTNFPEDLGFSTPVLTPEGNLLMAGGTRSTNFKTSFSAVVLHVGSRDDEFAASADYRWWLWAVLAVLLISAAAIVLFRRRKTGPAVQGENGQQSTVIASKDEDTLMLRINELMETRKMFLNPYLKITDVADALGTNRTYVSNSINAAKGCTFNVFINSYRVEYAKELMRKNPEMKMAEIWTASGFSTETSFFRNFKLFTDMTPKEWIATID